MTTEQAWDHCGSPEFHGPHKHTFTMNEGPYNSHCPGTPRFTSPTSAPLVLGRARPSWREYFITLVDAAAQRASCDRGLSGAIFVRDNDVLATGYVGAPPGLPDCDVADHLWQEVNLWNDETQAYDRSNHCVRTIHAEQNAILRAARTGTSLIGSTLYCTMEPCANCAMSVIGLGVVKVVAKNSYRTAQRSRDMLAAVGIDLEVGSSDLLYT